MTDPRYVAITMLDSTDKAVMSIKDRLAEHGYEAVIFQSSGGPAMGELAKAGMLVGAIDFIACEPSDEQVDALQLPRLVVPVCIEFSENDPPRVDVAQSIARWLNQARNPVIVMVPTKGTKAQGRTFLRQLMESLSAKVQLITIEADVNSSRFANRVADEFLQMVGGGVPAHQEGSSLA